MFNLLLTNKTFFGSKNLFFLQVIWPCQLCSFAKYFEKLTGIKTVSINWLRWNEIGMAEETDVPDAMDKEREQARLYGVDPQEGCKLYEIIVNSGLKQVMPSKVDVESELLGIELVSLDKEEEEISDIEDKSK